MRFSSSPLVQFACHSASALPRVPSLRLGITVGAVYDRPFRRFRSLSAEFECQFIPAA